MSKKLKMMGLALIAVSAFGAASTGIAQAALPEYTVEGLGAGVKAPLANTTTVTPASSDYTIPVTSLFKLTCTSLELDEGFVINRTEEGTIKSTTFFGCKVVDKNGKTTTCLVQGGTPAKNGEIHTGPIKLTLETGSKGEHLVKITAEAEAFAEIKITECLFEGRYKLIGTYFAEVPSPASGVFATNQTLSVFGATFDIHLASDALWTVDW